MYVCVCKLLYIYIYGLPLNTVSEGRIRQWQYARTRTGGRRR